MMKAMKPIGLSLLLLLSVVLFPIKVYADQITKEDVTLVYESLADGTIKVKYVENKSTQRVTISIDGQEEVTVNAQSSAQIQAVARKIVGIRTKSSGSTLWKYKAPEPADTPAEVVVEDKAQRQDVKEVATPETRTMANNMEVVRMPVQKERREETPITEKINQDSFFGEEAVNEYVRKCYSLEQGLAASSDKHQFIVENNLNPFLQESASELARKKDEILLIAQTVVSSTKLTDSSNILNLVVESLNNRISQRNQAYSKLKSEVEKVSAEDSGTRLFREDIVNYSVVCSILIVLALWTVLVIVRRKKTKAKKKSKSVATASTPQPEEANQAIVVRRRTTSILKKQSLEGVVDNPAYMVIHSADFVNDSAVRNIYIKNSCIKDIYNLYAEDLRNSDNPKEDGCMVLGRWVYDEPSRIYDVSLETVVLPGDDAIFKEYELNFGGKIKLRVAEKLRKLRRETNLQYDLVCWIHSHPGLGVFFSNSDDNVQNQLKHTQHPNFLIAFVIDILTSDQETGIFTFRKDGSMNSKGDLTKMYSLEEMYKWALENDKKSFSPENFYNILDRAKMKMPSCQGIELDNSSIIDLTKLVIETQTGLVGWVVGIPNGMSAGKEFVVSRIVKAEEKPTVGILGAVLNVSHFSLPTIQRLLVGESSKIAFVLVYSSKQLSLTSIPVINGELITDEQFYGDENIDDLKIWTRRKR